MNGRLEGDNTGYYVDGTVQHQYHYKDGKKTGSNYDYYPSQKVRRKEQLALNGIDLTAEEYTEDGQLTAIKKFRNNLPHGVWLTYNEGSKVVQSKSPYENGKLNGIRLTYYSDGKIQTEEEFKADVRTGTVTTYYDTGPVESVTQYRSNRKHGPAKVYYENGLLKEEGNFAANKKHGEWKTYNDQGVLMESRLFKAGEEQQEQ
jgi:antitoxin component YwqK of YwqJK toxin-antitoxin module